MRRALRDIATLAARLGVGGIFFANGWHKLEYGLTATSGQFADMDAPGPGIWAAATMLIELLGGALLVAGLAVPACGLILFTEALAVFALVSGDTGLPLTGGDINLVVALGAASVLLAVVGAGRLSVDHLVVIRRRGAEAAGTMATDAEADDVIASWRDNASGAAPADAGAPSSAKPPGESAAKSPAAAKASGTSATVTTGTEEAGEVTAPRRTSRGRRASKSPGRTEDTVTESPSEAPSALSGGHHRLVAGARRPGRASDPAG